MRVASLLLGLQLLCASDTLAASVAPAPLESKPRLSDAQIKQILIDESIASYSGNCPCPYNRASNGSRCGRRSAYSRAGGAEVLCYAKDVSAAMVSDYRQSHAQE